MTITMIYTDDPREKLFPAGRLMYAVSIPRYAERGWTFGTLWAILKEKTRRYTEWIR